MSPKCEVVPSRGDRTVADVFTDISQAVELASTIGQDNYDSGVSLGVQADRLFDLADRARSLAEEMSALNSVLN